MAATAVKRRPKGRYDETVKQEALGMYRDGTKAAEIARKVKCSVPVVYGWLKAAGVSTRRVSKVTEETSSEVSVTTASAPAPVTRIGRSSTADALHDALVTEARTGIELRLLRSENETLRQMCCEYQVQLREAQRRLRQEG